jgi:hypothetical protein
MMRQVAAEVLHVHGTFKNIVDVHMMREAEVSFILPQLHIPYKNKGWRFGLVVRAECWHAGDQGLNLRQGQHLYIWMYTPSAVNILGMEMCAM